MEATRASDARVAARSTYVLARCGGCGSRSLWPGEREDESPVLYQRGAYAPSRAGIAGLLEPLRRLGERDRLRALRGLARGARVLEIGAGDGRFLRTLERAGFSARGIDGFAAGRGVEAVALEDAELPASGADAAVLWHVLEHLDAPAEGLGRVRQALVPNGLLVVAVPNAVSLQAQIGGDRWFQRDVPRHAVQFTEPGLRALVQRCGFEVDRIRHVGIDQNLLAMWQTLLNRVTREQDVAFLALKGSLPHRSARAAAVDLAVSLVAGALLVAPSIAFEVAAGLAGRGGSLVLEARKAEA